MNRLFELRSFHRRHLPTFASEAFLCFGLLMLSISAGCGGSGNLKPAPSGPKGTVTGTVRYEGKPVTKGILNLDGGKGYLVTSEITEDGTYELKTVHGKSVPVGKYTVAVIPPIDPAAPTSPEEMAKLRSAPKPKAELPEKFYSNRTSGVTIEIVEGAQELDIDLK